MFLTLEKFLDYFPPVDISKENFVKRFTVQYRTVQTLETLFDLERSNVIKKATDIRYQNRDQIIDYFYEIVIEKRPHYLSLFYKSFFEFKKPTDLKWSDIDIRLPDSPTSLSLQKNDASRVMIRNLYCLEILHSTKITNTMENQTSFWQTLDNLYNGLRLEGRFFAPSSIGLFLREKQGKKYRENPEINYNNLFYLFQAYQPKASILNPYTIKWILDSLFPRKARLFTPVLSWSSYLTAFMHVPECQEYFGVDVMPSVCQKTRFLADYYKGLGPEFAEKKVTVVCQPSETLDARPLTGYFDAAIVCPPYFNMEIYPEGDQSLTNYPDYREWLEKYWRPTVEMTHSVLSPGARFGVIINDYYDLEGNFYPLSEDLDKITRSTRFELVEVYRLFNRTSPLRQAKKDRSERLYLYKV